MQRSVLLQSICAGMLCVLATTHGTAAEDPPIVAQELQKLRIPGRVAAVWWTRRPDYYTLQLAYPTMGRVMLVMKEDPKLASHGSNVQMWLLKADGSIILPLWRSTDASTSNASTKGKIKAAPMNDVIFRFPLSAGKEAVAAAVQIGDTFMVDQITPSKD